MADSNIQIKLTLDNKDYVSKLEESAQKTKKFGKDSGSLVENFAGFAKGAVGVAAVAVALKKVFDATNDSVTSQVKLNSVLNSTKNAAGLSAIEINKFAEALSKNSNYTKTEIINAESLMLTFTRVGKEVFPQAIEAVLDMSAALGTDLKGSSIQLGKALNDPIKGVSALQEVGVTFTQQQKMMIENFIRQGNVAGAQKVILEELKTEFGGMSKALQNTPLGQMEALGKIAKDNAVIVGEELLPSFTHLTSALRNASDGSGILTESFKLLSQPLKYAIDGIAYLIEGLDTMSKSTKDGTKEQKEANDKYKDFLQQTEVGIQLTKDYAREKDNLAYSTREAAAAEAVQGSMMQRLMSSQSAYLESTKKLIKNYYDDLYKSKADQRSNDTKMLDAENQQMAQGMATRARVLKTYLDYEISAKDNQLIWQRTKQEEALGVLKQIKENELNADIDIETRKQIVQYQAEQSSVQMHEQALRAKLGMDSMAFKGMEMYAQAAAQLMSSQNKALFKIGQAGAVANVILNTSQAITKGFAQMGVFGWPFAGLMGLVAATQIQNIMSQKPATDVKFESPNPTPPTVQPQQISFEPVKLATGLWEVPYDNYPALLHKGEMVPSRPFAEEYRANVRSGGSQSTIVHTQINLDGKEIAAIVDEHRNQTAANMGAGNYAVKGVY